MTEKPPISDMRHLSTRDVLTQLQTEVEDPDRDDDYALQLLDILRTRLQPKPRNHNEGGIKKRRPSA